MSLLAYWCVRQQLSNQTTLAWLTSCSFWCTPSPTILSEVTLLYTQQLSLVSDQPIDTLRAIRKNNKNIRKPFGYAFLITSGAIFLIISIGQALEYFKSPQIETQTGLATLTLSDKVLKIINQLCPNFHSKFTLIQSLLVFLSALAFSKFISKEEMEAVGHTLESERQVDTIAENRVEKMKNHQIQKAVQLIKDYKFKSQAFNQLQLLILTVTCSISVSILTLPYTLILFIQILALGFSGSEKFQRNLSIKINMITLALVITDLLSNYIIIASSIVNEKNINFAQITGILSNVPSYIEFYTKILLLLVECSRVQYNYKYDQLYSEIKENFADRSDLKKHFRKRISFTYRVLKPISLFMFCSLALLFNLTHPSVVFLVLSPICVSGFFIKIHSRAKICTCTLILVYVLYSLIACSMSVAFLLVPETQVKEDLAYYFDRILGVENDPKVYSKLFPWKLDLFSVLVLAYFSHFIQMKERTIAEGDRYESNGFDQARNESLIKQGLEDDMLTIPDDISEVRSKISYKPGYRYRQSTMSEKSVQLTNRNTQGQNIPETIIEDKKEDDEHDVEETQSLLNTSKTQSNVNYKHARHSNLRNTDETMRGSLRRTFFKLYIKLRGNFVSLIDLMIIHSAKFALCAIFFVSVTHANLFNASLFMIFLFFSISNFREVQKYWKLSIFVDSVILISIYAIDVFRPEEILNLDEATLTLIGISKYQKNEPRLLKYTPYLLLLSVLVIADYILNSQRYEDFLMVYNQIEMRDRLDDEDDTSDDLNGNSSKRRKDRMGVSDKLTKFLIKNSLYMMLIALFVECTLLPVSVLNFILLLLMCMITAKYLKSSESIELYKALYGNLMALKWISLVFIFLKYMFQLEEFAYTYAFREANKDKSYFEHLPLIEKLLGIENSLVPVKLFSLAIVMSISNLQLKFVSYKYLSNILREQDSDWKRLKQFSNRFSYFIHNLRIYLLFGAYHLIQPLPVISTVFYSLRYPSVIGLLLFVGVIYLANAQKGSLWMNQHNLICTLISFGLVSTYALQFIFLNISINEQFMNWIGVIKQDEVNNLVYSQLLYLFLVLALCALQKESRKLEGLFKVTVTEQDLNACEQQSSEQNQEQQEEMLKTFRQLQIIYEFEKPIRACLDFRDYFIKSLLYQQSHLISILFQIAIVLYKLNLTAIIQGFIAVALLKSNYYPNLYQTSINDSSKRSRLSSIIKTQIYLLSVIVIAEFGMMIGQTYINDTQIWKTFVGDMLCKNSDFICNQEWQSWLSVSDISSLYIVIDLVGLLLAIVAYLFSSEIVSIRELQLEDKVYSDDSRKSTQGQIKTFIFSGFPYLIVLFLMIFAATYQDNGTSDFISAGYLILAIYYVVNFRKLFTKNIKILEKVRNYNIVVLIAQLIFQAPIFQCPFQNETNSFVAREQCALVFESRADGVSVNSSALSTFYLVFIQSVGLSKKRSCLQTESILIILILEIQNYLFSHPYFEQNILERMKSEKETDAKLRAFVFVERIHLQRLWAYQAIKQEIKILHARLVKINNTIKNQEFSRYLLFEIDKEGDVESNHLLAEENSHESEGSLEKIQNLGLFTEEQKKLNTAIDLLVDEYKEQIEDISLELLQSPEAPVVPINYFYDSLRQYLKSRTDIHEQLLEDKISEETKVEIQKELIQLIEDIQRQILNKNRIDLYYKEGLGLHFAVKNGSEQFLNQGDDAFHRHLILHQDEVIADKQGAEISKEQVESNALEQIKTKEVESQASNAFKEFLLRNMINNLIFLSITTKGTKQPQIASMSLFKLLGYSLLCQSVSVCYAIIFMNFIFNPNLLSLIPALSILFYALIDFPVPNVKYFKSLIIYTLSLIAIKFAYQLPIFCGSTPYSLYFSEESCPSFIILPENLLTRVDYIIGVYKFSGSYSEPRDQGILMGLLGDLFVLLSLLVLKNYLVKVGIWHFVKVRSDIYQSPAFKCPSSELSEKEQLQIIGKENFQIQVYEQANLLEKMIIKIKQGTKLVLRYFLKVMPTYMKSTQSNLDLRYQEHQPLVSHSVKKAKPGRDYFSLNFFSLLMILLFNLFWYRSVNGEQQSGAALSAASLQRFSTPQVGLIFSLLLLMMGERMLFRVRYFDQTRFAVADSGLLGKHQLTIKFILHLIIVVLVHAYLGFIIPRHNLRSFSKLIPLLFCYLLWIIYFIGSALQIKYGYPQAPFKAPFTRDTSFFKVWAFRVYKAIPFLWEMKVIIDWTVTATCLDLFQWFKLDDAYNYLYWNKYQIDDRKKRQEYAQRSWEEKFFQGFCFALGLIIVILAPILLFSGINPIMVKNPVQQGQLSISFELNKNGNTYSILQSQAFNIAQLSENEVSDLSSYFSPIDARFQAVDMQKMHFSPYSDSGWSISPPSLQKFVEDYLSMKNQSEAFVEVKSNWVFKRNNPVGNEATQSQHSYRMSILKLQPIIDMLNQGLQTESANSSLSNTSSPILNSTIHVDNLLPKIFKLGSAQLSQPLEVQPTSSMSAYSACILTLNRVIPSQDTNGSKLGMDGGLYWTYSIPSTDSQGVFNENKAINQTNTSPQNLIILAFNEEVIGSLFGSAFQLSVVGLYATIVVAIGRFLRLIFDRISQRVIYEEMNHIEQLFEICEGIFIAQLEGDLVREKKLYELLIRIYRSPEILMKITEHPHTNIKGYNSNQASISQTKLLRKNELVVGQAKLQSRDSYFNVQDKDTPNTNQRHSQEGTPQSYQQE